MNRSPVQGEHLAPSAADSSAGQSPSLPSYRPLPPRALRLVLILAALSLTVVLSYLVAGTESGLTMTNEDVDTPQLLLEEAWPFRHLALNASQQPGKLFKDSLRPDRRYLTGFASAGFTNHLLGAMNLLHVAYHMGRMETSSLPLVVVLPPVPPHYTHLEATGDYDVDPFPIDGVFDLPTFEQATSISVVSFNDIKDLSQADPALESVACWSPTWSQFGRPDAYRPIDEWLGIKRILTPLPPSLLSPTDRQPPHYLLPSVAGLLSPADNKARLDFLSGQSREGALLMSRWGMGDADWRSVWGNRVADWRAPDDGLNGTLACIDGSYYGSERGEEVREMYLGQQTFTAAPFGPWSTIGRHLRWHSGLLAEAEATLRLTLGVKDGAPLPSPLATMHIRRGDFISSCKSNDAWQVAQDGAVGVYARHLAAIQERLASVESSDARDWPVIVTTDEKDPAYLLELEAQGWRLVDHAAMKTKKRVGHWGPTLLDVAILSLGKLFVGTDESTMSILTLRRVQDWNGGVGTLVNKWEKL